MKKLFLSLAIVSMLLAGCGGRVAHVEDAVIKEKISPEQYQTRGGRSGYYYHVVLDKGGEVFTVKISREEYEMIAEGTKVNATINTSSWYADIEPSVLNKD